MSATSLTPRRLRPATPLSEDEHRRTIYRITSIQDGRMPGPVVVRMEDQGVVRTSAIMRQGEAAPTSLVSAIMRTTSDIARRISDVRHRRAEEEQAPVANIVAFVPAHNEEEDIAETIESLLMQTRRLDLIVVIGNNTTDRTAEIAQRYADAFPQLVVEDVQGFEYGKVDALNYAWHKYASMGQFTFVLGVDADVECDKEMVEHLERDLIHQTKSAGVMARYGFKIPEQAKRREKRLIMNQRHEFGMTGIKQQLRGGRSDILGGQATLFRAEALSQAAHETDGGAPWNIRSSVEDAELTRTFQRLGYRTAVSNNARAWVGAMHNAYAWDKQRKKWEIGHLTDMIRDFHPIQDRRRWLSQVDIGWNLLIRVLFVTLLVTSISLHKYTFNPLWLIPIGLSIFQSLLVACKLPNRRAGEILRSLCFFPGEFYLWKTLAVWLSSVSKVIFDIRHNLWERQYSAEAAAKTRSVSAWMTILLSVLLPTVVLNLLGGIISSDTMDVVLTTGWWALTGMTVFSVVWMVVWIFRILRKFRSLAP